MYHTWLSERMDAADFEKAAEYLWATREFFPPPTAFLLPVARRTFNEALEVASATAYGTYEEIGAQRVEAMQKLSEPARKALLAMGGWSMLYKATMENATRAMDTWTREYELAEAGGLERPGVGIGADKPRRAVSEPRGGGWTPVGPQATEASRALPPPSIGSSETP